MSLMLSLPFIKPVSLLGHVSLYLSNKISMCLPQGPDNADVFMAPNEEDTQQISEGVLKESKIIQEEIKSLLSEVCLVDGNSCNNKFYFCTSPPQYSYMAIGASYILHVTGSQMQECQV